MAPQVADSPFKRPPTKHPNKPTIMHIGKLIRICLESNDVINAIKILTSSSAPIMYDGATTNRSDVKNAAVKVSRNIIRAFSILIIIPPKTNPPRAIER